MKADSLAFDQVLVDEEEELEETEAQKIENKRFTKHSPLSTLLIMSIGPLSLLVQAIGEAIDMYQVGYRFNSDPSAHAVQMLGFCHMVNTTVIYLGFYFGQCIVARATTLISMGKRKDASQLIADVYRVSFVFCLLFSIGYYFLVKPFLRFCGCPPDLLQGCFELALPIVWSAPGLTFFVVASNYMQSIGRTLMSALLKVIAYVIQCGVNTPIILFAFRAPTKYIKCSQAVSQSTVGLVMFILIFCGKLDLKVEWNSLISKFSKEFPKALLLAAPMLLQLLCMILPPIFILQSLSIAAGDDADSIGGVFAVYNRIYSIAIAFPSCVSLSFLSCGTQAYGSGNYKRLLTLFLWTFLLSFIVMFIFTPPMIAAPDKVAAIFLSDRSTEDLMFAKKLLPIPFYTSYLQSVAFTSSIMLIILGRPISALIAVTIQTCLLSGGCKVIEKYITKDPIKIMHIFNVSDGAMVVIYGLLLIKPLIIFRKQIVTQKDKLEAI